MNYYNEFDPKAAQWLRNLIAAGFIPPGDVDERSITEVKPDDLKRYTQCHFFAGIGGWSYALHLAGWPPERPIWTGSCPCQPFSSAGKQKGKADDRHLWPVWFDLIRSCRPPVIMGEQVAAAIGHGWIDGVFDDLEREGYACGAAIVPACAVNAPHRRDRLWFVADTEHHGSHGCQITGSDETAYERRAGGQDSAFQSSGGGASGIISGGTMGNAPEPRSFSSAQSGIHSGEESAGSWHGEFERHGNVGNASCARGEIGIPTPTRSSEGQPEIIDNRSSGCTGPWGECEFLTCADGKARRVVTDIRSMVDGISERMAGLLPEYFFEAEKEIINYAKTTQSRPCEILSALQHKIASEKIWQEPRGFFSISEAEILLPYLRELNRRINGKCSSVESKEIKRECLRGLRIHASASCPSQERGLYRQQAGEYSNSLCVLSQLLARLAGQAFEAMQWDAPIVPLLEKDVPARVAKLRALGNAIVPQVAAKIIRAYMETVDA